MKQFTQLLIIATACCLASFVTAAESDFLGSPGSALERLEQLASEGNARSARTHIYRATEKYPKAFDLFARASEYFEAQELWGEAELMARKALALRTDPAVTERLERIQRRLDRLASKDRVAAISAQKFIDGGDWLSAISVADRAIAQWPENDLFFQLKGEALYKANELEAAEVALRQALKINPLNSVAKAYVEEIRTTTQAQVSEEWAEWMSIAKDKVGDFIVTFLALFAAFVTNSLIAPVILQIKLTRARRALEKGSYDEFTDLIEGLLDLENFGPIRANFRFLLRQKSYDEAQEILNKYVMTLDRLPTLLRILEREHEKLLEAS